MILNSHDIKDEISKGLIAFAPALDGFQVQPNSIDLRVGWSFYIPETWEYTDAGRVAIRADYLDIQKNKHYFKLIKLKPGQYFEILPNEFIIISTLEKLSLNAPDVAAMLAPRSSVIRRGLSIQGGVVDAYFEGHMTIPVMNNSNHSIILYPGERFVQLVLHKLTAGLTKEEALMTITLNTPKILFEYSLN